jgi:hypothetical protein
VGVGILVAVLVVALGCFAQVRKKYGMFFWWGAVLVIVGTLPAAIATDIPHSNRAFLASAGYIILASGGAMAWGYFWKKRREFANGFLALLLVITALFYLGWWRNYLVVMAPEQEEKEVMTTAEVKELQQAVNFLYARDLREAMKDTWEMAGQVKQIVVATGLEHEYIYALLATGIKPISYQGGALSEKYLFLPEIKASDWERKNTLLVVAKEEVAIPTWAKENVYKDYFNLTIYKL